MTTHIKILGALYIALGSIGVLVALLLLLFVGGAASLVGVAADSRDAILAVPIIGIAGTAIVVFLLILSLPGIIAGIGLLNFRPWARILTLVLSALNLLNVPFGTLLGAYGLWVLLSRDTEPLFVQPTPVPPPSS
jgi:hypothetical protein